MKNKSKAKDEASALSGSRHTDAWIHIAAVTLGVLPIYLGLIMLQRLSDNALSMHSFILYLAVICPLSLVIVWLLLRFLCGEKFRELDLKPGKLSSDLLAALGLSVVILVANVIASQSLSGMFPESPANTSVRNLFMELAGNLQLLILFVGLIFLGAASEEIIRVFLLSRLWKVWPSTVGKLLTVFISAALFGFIHLYQGPAGAVWTAIFGIIMAFTYLRFGRIFPLILSHYLTNTLQLIVFAVLAR